MLPRFSWPALAMLMALSTALLSTSTTAQALSCSSSAQCPKTSPCCGVGNTCGSGALQCAGGCQPLASYQPTSCLANPVCTNKNLTFAPTDYNNPHMFWPILLYNGNSSHAPFTLDYGSLGKGPTGVLLELTAATQTKISTTDYMLYGQVQVTARHNPIAGLVFAFITMSDIKDEIDWEFPGAGESDLQTNYFGEGVVAKGTAATVTDNSVQVSDWHTYGLNWQPNQLQWTIDGKVLRTVTAASAGVNYPRSPSRIQVSVWAGGNSTNPQGVIDWAGGPIDWTSSNYTDTGFYSAEITSFVTNCASQSASGVSTVGSGNTTTSYIYTGQQSSSLNEPAYVLNTDPITFLSNPSVDGSPNLPGYSTQTPFTKSNSNAWDGSGNTSGLTKEQITDKPDSSNSESDGSSGSSSSSGGGSFFTGPGSKGGWLANNKYLSIAVPVAAGALVLGCLWALGTCLYRRNRRKRAHNNELGSGVLAQSGVALNGGSRLNDKSSRYQALEGGDDDDHGSSHGSQHMYDATPMGAVKIGQGYGPAAGPRPGQMGRQEWSDSSASVDELKEPYNDYPMTGARVASPAPQQRMAYGYGAPAPPRASSRPVVQARSPPPAPAFQYQASPYPRQMATPAMPGTPYSPHAIRGPYTPGMNAYTPAVHQTPSAMQSAFASSQITYNPPQRFQGQGGPPRNGGGPRGY